MTHFLVSDENPDGHKLEDLLCDLRADIINRCSKITSDKRPEAMAVLANNIKVLEHLSEAIHLATESTKILDRSFGPSSTASGGPTRIGVK
ncbi:MAG: histidine kinase [Robiginitomaculum sp.]|nr:histidine kinase [Robiginitomaculum sp.]